MTWTVTVVDTITGEPIDTVPVSEFPWARALSAGSTQRCVLPVAASEYDAWDASELTDLLAADWSRTMVLDWDGTVRAAGIIVDQDWDDQSSVTLTLTDIWGLFDRRGGWDRTAPLVNEWSVSYTDLTLGTLAKRVIELGVGAGAGADSSLPVTLPSDVSGSLDRERFGYHLEFVGDVLEDLIAEGLELDFRPRWVDGVLDWEMIVDPATSTHEWVKNGPTGNMAGFRRRVNGARVTNNPIFVGEGSGVDMVVRSHPNDDSLLPALDRLEARKNVADGTALAAMATAARGRFEAPTEEWSFVTLRSGSPDFTTIQVGDTAEITVSGDRVIPDGVYERRVVRVSGGLGEQITVVCQPFGGV